MIRGSSTEMMRVRLHPVSAARLVLLVSAGLVMWSFFAYRSLRHRYPGFLNALSQRIPLARSKSSQTKSEPLFSPVNRSPQHLKSSAIKFARKHKMGSKINRLYAEKSSMAVPLEKRRTKVRRSRVMVRVRNGDDGGVATVPVKMRSKKWEPCLSLPLEKGSFWRSSPFGPRRIGRRWGFHRGIDMAAPKGTPIKAAGEGIVVEACSTRGYGNTVVIDHGRGMKTRYAHLSTIKVRSGKKVKRGDIIGRVGATGRVRKRPGGDGSHLHFEVEIDGTRMNPDYFLM